MPTCQGALALHKPALLHLAVCTWSDSVTGVTVPCCGRTLLEPEGAMQGEGKGPNTLPGQQRDRTWRHLCPQADRPSADSCRSTAARMALLGPSQDVQENKTPPACSACASENSPSLFLNERSLSTYSLATYRNGFYQKDSKRGTLITFPLQLFPLTLPYLYVLVSDRDTE